jgi:lipoprotein-releasing system permease protein
VGSRVYVVNPMGEVGPNGVTPKSRAFVVIGLSHSGMYEFDSTFAFISLAAAQSYFNYGDAVSGIEVSLTDLWQSEKIGADIEQRLGWPYYTRDWKVMNRNLFSALKLQKLVMFMILCLIVFVAALNIFSTLYMVIMDKKRSLAMLRAMGAAAGDIRKIVLVQGMFIGVLGSIIGAILGVALCQVQIRFGLVRLDPKVYFIDTLPMAFKALDLAMIFVAALGFSLIATLLPARMAARMDAVTVLRYE